MHAIPTKKLFLIRHGQSEGNIKKVFQDEHDPLTELGHKQVKKIAERAKKLNADLILSSPMVRALETARAIQEATNAPLEELELLREYRVPSSLVNSPINSKESDAFHRELFKNIHNPTWKYADEDNYFELHKRATDVMQVLKDRPERNIIVVSHGAFMSILLTAMMSEGEPDPITSTRMFRFLRKENTGLTVIDYMEHPFISNTWRLRSWNDYSHLSAEEKTLS